MKSLTPLLSLIIATAAFAADTRSVSIRFHATVGSKPLACGQHYDNIGTSNSRITPRDFRFYISDVRLIDASGASIPLTLHQDGKWQLENLALLDFENATGACSNGTPDTNASISGTIPSSASPRGLRFTLGVPFALNHTDLTAMPSPLNLTALAWSWNLGRKFARLDFSSTGAPRGYAVHLGSTACSPSETKTTIPATCANSNRLDISFPEFDPASDLVIADLAALLQNSNVDQTSRMMSGCMSSPETPACAPLFRNLGLPFPNQPTLPQTFFRKAPAASLSASR